MYLSESQEVVDKVIRYMAFVAAVNSLTSSS